MFCVYSEVMAQDDTATLYKTTPHLLLPMSEVDQSKLLIHEVPPFQKVKSIIINCISMCGFTHFDRYHY